VQWTSILAIYFLLWVLSAFLMLPFGMRTHDEAGIDKIPGQADSAPADFRPGRVILRATILAAVLCGLFVANYANGWITVQDIDFIGTPESFSKAEPSA
jgi:predicted secreted protein